ncbi:MAG: DUF4197 domain-containing protein [bacterium]
MQKIIIIFITVSGLLLGRCAELNEFMPAVSPQSGGLTRYEIIKGLKEALVVGAENSVSSASVINGFYNNPEIFIPFPPEAVKVKNTLEQAGFSDMIKDFEKSINRAAEEASKKALPIFRDAITSMTIRDAVGILKGTDNAATMYLRSNTEEELKAEFMPVVKNAVDKVEVTSYWNPVATAYNRLTLLTGGSQVNPNLKDYITQKALDGLFVMIAQEEKKIRRDPAARVTYILKRVFGAQ